MKVQDKMAENSSKKSKKLLRKENFCFEDTPMVIKSYMQKQFAKIVGMELEEAITSLIVGPRSKSIIDIAERLLEQLSELTGEKCTLQTPKNITQDIMVFIADRAGVWLNEVVDESDAILLDKREKKLRGIDEGGKGDAGDGQSQVDDDVEIIQKNKKPSVVSQPFQSGDGDNTDKRRDKGGEKQDPPPSRPSKSKQSADEPGKEKAKGQSSGKQSPKSKIDVKSPGEKKGESKGATDGDASKKSVTSKPKSSKPTTREGSKQGGTRSKGSAGDTKAGTKSQQGVAKDKQGGASGKKSMSKPSSKPMDKGPSPSAGSTKPSTFKDQNKVSQDGIKKDTSDSGKSLRSSQVPPQRPRTASELKREKTAEILNTHLAQMVQETDKKPTPRQEALQDVISKRLEDKVGPRDSATIDAIREASALMATYIDRMTANVEQEYAETTPAENQTPIAQRGKGPVFSVRKQPSNYFIRQVPHTEAKAKVYKSRGLPTPGAIALTEGAFKPSETKEWANWANEVANMADRWSKWIDSTVTDAITAADKRKSAGVTNDLSTSSWRDWKVTTGAEALEWRRNKKLLDTQARLFSDKAESIVRPKSAPTAETKKNQTKKKIP